MKTKIERHHFSFQPSSFGRYAVIYTSPVTGKKWKALVYDMQLIDATKNCDCPKQVDLKILLRRVKQDGYLMKNK